MKQYNGIKAKYPDALLLFRVGDFYETFGSDAVKAADVLGIVLTKRANGAASEMELAGFPHHSLDTYLPKLVRAGFRVAICDQLEDPKKTKTIVKRGVTELITPGVAHNDQILENKSNNFLAAVFFEKDQMGLALTDISTGEFLVAEGSVSYIDKLIQSFSPAEILFSKQQEDLFSSHVDQSIFAYGLDNWIFDYDYTSEQLLQHYKIKSFKGFGIDGMSLAIVAAGVAFHYLQQTEHKNLEHLDAITRIDHDRYVWLDRFSIRNLELTSPLNPGATTLLQILDRTCSPMGSRTLRKWVCLPLKTVSSIKERHSIVSHFIQQEALSEEIRDQLEQIGDLERLITKIPLGKINPRELIQLKRSLECIEPIKKCLSDISDTGLRKLGDQLNPCPVLIEQISHQVREDAPALISKGAVFNEGIDAELDELRDIITNGKNHILAIQQREQEATGITSLKVGFNNVFGYYLEVTNAHKDKVPEVWIRKQTLTNAERYITEELKTLEQKILGAEEKILAIEERLFQELVTYVSDYLKPIQLNARLIGQLDAYLSFAKVAVERNYCLPEMDDSTVLDIKDGRHPVIEHELGPENPYVPNDLYLDTETQQIMVITGPNMSGKSAILRQTALIVLMAQIGSFVPAKSARIGVVDKVFTRVGASDNISSGESTFMVEMNETASILNNVSPRSLIILDEIGRGTSTYDGISIAWSIAEYLHNHPEAQAKTLFATHYHELNELADKYKRIRNYSVSTREVDQKVIFLRKLILGGSKHSFGIHVASMAGMPTDVIKRATALLKQLERKSVNADLQERIKEIPAENFQLSFFDAGDPKAQKVKEILASVDLNTLTPIEAMLKLQELKQMINDQ